MGSCGGHPAPLRNSTRPHGAQRPCKHANAVLMVEPHDSVAAIVPALRSQEKALLEQIEIGTATHLALECVQAIHVALYRAMTPGQGDPGFDRIIVVAPPFRKPLQGHEGTLRCPGQPRVQLVRLTLAHEPRKVLGSGDGGGHLRMLSFQLGEWGGLVIILPLWSPQRQPGRSPCGELALRRLRHNRQDLPRRAVLPGLALRLAQTLRIAGHGRGAPSIPPPLELPEESQGVTVTRVPAFQEIRFIGGEETAAAISAALALRHRRRAEVAIDGILANPQLLGHGPPGPPLLVEAPELLMERQPPPLALVGQLLDHP